MQLPNPLPHTLREAVWQALVAILLATRLKDIIGFCRRLWSALRESSSTAHLRAAEAHRTDAEAEAIQADTMISLFREMRVSMNQAARLREKLNEEMASKESIIALQKAELTEWRMRHPEDVRNKKNGA